MMIVNDEMSPELQFLDTPQSRQLATIRPLMSSVDDDQCGCARTDDGEWAVYVTGQRKTLTRLLHSGRVLR